MALSEAFENLVEQAFSGNGEAFDELYKRIHRYLINIMGDFHLAEDVTQETLQRIWKGWKNGIRDKSKLKSWIFQVAHNAAIDHLRKIKRSTISLDDLNNSDTSSIRDCLYVLRSEEIPEEYIIRLENRLLLKEILSRISEVQRSCFVLYFVEKAKLGEIAEIHQCSERTVQRHIESVRKEFRQICDQLTRRQDWERSSDS